jgi:DNA-directed RNA polymerase specialized sigma24 family protein
MPTRRRQRPGVTRDLENPEGHGPAVPCPVMAAIEDVDAFLRSPRGHAATWRALDRQHLPQSLAEDVVQEVLARTAHAEAAGTAIENPEAWAARLLHRASVDLLRGELRARWPAELTRIDAADAANDPAAAGAPALDDLDAAATRDLRRALLTAVPPVTAAGALARLAIVLGAEPAPDCPQPKGGAGADAAADWAAIWYGGEHAAFTRPDTPTVRKRRERAINAMRAALLAAAQHAGIAEGAPDA